MPMNNALVPMAFPREMPAAPADCRANADFIAHLIAIAAQAPQTAFQSLSAPARFILLAEQTRDVEHGRPERAYSLLRRYIASTVGLTCIVTPPLWIYMPSLVRLVYGAKYVPAANAFRVMLLAAVLQLIFGWTKTFPVSIGRVGLRIVRLGVLVLEVRHEER